MARPGIMLYFDMLGPIRVLPDADKGRLLVAMLEYGKDGIVPQFDGMLALAWEFVKPKIDRDKESYDRQIQQKQYASFSREVKKRGLSPVSFEEWKCLSDIERERVISGDIERYPTTTTTATPSTNISTTITTAAAATTNTNEDGGDGSERRVKVLGGELGKSVVFLSDEQFDDLLDRMDLDTFNYYVDKLSNFIIKNDARVKNHYETILKWWKEDSIVHRPRKKEEIPKGGAASGKLGQAELAAIQRVLAEE